MLFLLPSIAILNNTVVLNTNFTGHTFKFQKLCITHESIILRPLILVTTHHAVCLQNGYSSVLKKISGILLGERQQQVLVMKRQSGEG